MFYLTQWALHEESECVDRPDDDITCIQDISNTETR